jgi:hypothetical protein
MRMPLRALLNSIALFLVFSTSAQQLVPTRGKEFWFGFMENIGETPTLQLVVYVSSEVNTTGVMSSPLSGWSQPFTVAANTVTQLQVPLSNAHVGSEVVDTRSVLIQTEDTVAVYALNFEQATADATVIYPTRSLGTRYRVHAYEGLVESNTANSELLIVATADATEIEITPSCNTFGGALAGQTFTVQLNQGESYQVQAALGIDDLTGTLVQNTAQSGSCRPFAVFSGSVCARVPTDCVACDHLFEQNLPTPFWGTSYYSVPWEDSNGYTYRLLADEDNTTITVDNDPPVILSAGQILEVNNTNVPHCFSGNQPFSVSQLMQGSTCSGLSDPALLILNAQEQKINDITFATVISNNITAQYINVVVDIADVTNVILDGVAVPTIQFTAFPVCSDKAFATLPLTQGSHRVSCVNGLTGYVYGTGPNNETYAYSVGSFTPLDVLAYDTAFCVLDTNDVITLSSAEPIFNPVWPAQSNPNDTLAEGFTYTFQPTASDVYILSGSSNASDCLAQFFFSVELIQPPTPSIAPLASICAYTPLTIDLQLDPNGTYVYDWSPDAGLNNDNLQDPVVTPVHSGWYHVDISSLSGCSYTQDSVFITVTDGDVLGVQATSVPGLICVGNSAQLDVTVRQIIAQDDLNNGVGAIWEQV